jgi:hypothetical protein
LGCFMIVVVGLVILAAVVVGVAGVLERQLQQR